MGCVEEVNISGAEGKQVMVGVAEDLAGIYDDGSFQYTVDADDRYFHRDPFGTLQILLISTVTAKPRRCGSRLVRRSCRTGLVADG